MRGPGATTAALALAYVSIDAMAFLGLPADREVQGRADLIAWVDTYMKGHPRGPSVQRLFDQLHSDAFATELARRLTLSLGASPTAYQME